MVGTHRRYPGERYTPSTRNIVRVMNRISCFTIVRCELLIEVGFATDGKSVKHVSGMVGNLCVRAGWYQETVNGIIRFALFARLSPFGLRAAATQPCSFSTLAAARFGSNRRDRTKSIRCTNRYKKGPPTASLFCIYWRSGRDSNLAGMLPRACHSN